MKYVKLFETHEEYEDYAESGMILPNVSHCVQEDDIHYNPWTWADEYLTFVARENGTFTFTPYSTNAISYSTDNGKTWTQENSVNVNNGDRILWKGTMTPSSNGIGEFGATGNFDVQGNIMSLLYGDNYKGQTDLTGKNNTFKELFSLNKKVINAENLSLPATTLASDCYRNMFGGCTNLTTVPKLPATTLKSGCYQNMFSSCTNITSAPALPATTLTSQCYAYMFFGCTSLVTAPELPATTLAKSCYVQMFKGCTSLTTTPTLPATTLATYCYDYMFEECTNLTTAPILPATTLVGYCYRGMFKGCTSLTTAPELPATTLATYCYSAMFNGCTSLTTTPSVLPATTLATYCYSTMFFRCTSLTTAPILPATTLVSNCYNYIFQGCTSLNYIKAMFTTTPSNSYTGQWVQNVASSGIFVKNSAAQWDVSGVNGIPTGWTVQTASA